MDNPFYISFGKKPLEYISRFRQTQEILDAFSSQNMTQQIFIITGVRGSGKTVLMNTIANTLEKEPGWIVLRLIPEEDLLLAMGARLCGNSECTSIFRDAKLNLSVFGFGMELEASSPALDSQTAIEKMLKALRQEKKRVLITVDEVTNTSYVQSFCSFFQVLIGEELPVFLLMTGLYENIEDLQNEKTLTFLYRAPKLMIEPLNIGSIASRYAELFHIPKKEAIQLANLTRGYSFAFQALGYSMWNHGTDQNSFLPEFRQLLDEYIYDKLWSELSQKDKKIVSGIAHSSSGKIKDINDYLKLKPDEINQYRRRLIRKGIVDGSSHGYLYFTLPLFAAYVLEREIG